VFAPACWSCGNGRSRPGCGGSTRAFRNLCRSRSALHTLSVPSVVRPGPAFLCRVFPAAQRSVLPAPWRCPRVAQRDSHGRTGERENEHTEMPVNAGSAAGGKRIGKRKGEARSISKYATSRRANPKRWAKVAGRPWRVTVSCRWARWTRVRIGEASVEGDAHCFARKNVDPQSPEGVTRPVSPHDGLWGLRPEDGTDSPRFDGGTALPARRAQCTTPTVANVGSGEQARGPIAFRPFEEERPIRESRRHVSDVPVEPAYIPQSQPVRSCALESPRGTDLVVRGESKPIERGCASPVHGACKNTSGRDRREEEPLHALSSNRSAVLPVRRRGQNRRSPTLHLSALLRAGCFSMHGQVETLQINTLQRVTMFEIFIESSSTCYCTDQWVHRWPRRLLLRKRWHAASGRRHARWYAVWRSLEA
jgi:hypothetical protein